MLIPNRSTWLSFNLVIQRARDITAIYGVVHCK
uniref:Uncharacterized protein n=1 Tax=Siphoviridae sp. ctGKi16 TaxID=2825410 RepID=A0A8S5Q598_9CAUD|nr:MAG TPA: hypothetical protein [Siphoviridae sp. ctGKi16]